jgi:uncharacterized membrane protein YeaQ/YmgE (transglycosylase-associated protein family)
MSLILWMVIGALSAWLARKMLSSGEEQRSGGRKRRLSPYSSLVAGALGAASIAALVTAGGSMQEEFVALWRVSTVFIGAVGILVIASRSTGGRLR